MSLLQCCDRCGKTTDNFDGDELPDNWRTLGVPVRGSAGARSVMAHTICGECDDDLYRWWNRTGEYTKVEKA